MTSSAGDPEAQRARRSRARRQLLGATIAVAVVVVVFVIYLVWPIVFSGPTGLSGQQEPTGYPASVVATGEDGRERSLRVRGVDDSEVDLERVTQGDRLVVSGTGFNSQNGIYVAVCKIPDSPDQRPGPCLGGVPSTEVEGDDGQRTIEWAAANWINDDWAWKLFGARGYDDPAAGDFTAYLELGPPADEFVDCRVEACAIYTRNDHTALDNRMQDLYLPVAFSE